MRRILFPILLLAIDIAGYLAAFFITVELRAWLGVQFAAIPVLSPETMRLRELYFMPALLVVVFLYEGLYVRRIPFLDELREIFKSLLILTVFLFALISIGKLAHLVSRLTIVLMAPIAFFCIAFFRYWGKRALYKTGVGLQNLLIVGEADAAIKIQSALSAEKTLGYRFLGFVPLDRSQKLRARRLKDHVLPVIGELRDLEKLLRQKRAECVLLAMPHASREKTSQLAERVYRHVHHVLVIPEMRSGALLNSELYHLFVQQLFLIKLRNSLTGKPARFTKMVFDISLVLLSLPLLLPFFIVIAAVIRITSRGPAIYGQTRIGKNGRRFKVLKFRTMYRDAESRLQELLAHDPAARAEWQKYHKLRNDPRITPIGRWLRRSSLDELPQLLNVLKGEMSLVGPRPVTEAELRERYRERADYYKLVRPGITGLWQISGRNDVSYEERVNLDTWYVFNWSLYIDMVILYKTIGVVLRQRGAY
ncbi:MAG: undecaprenyl-phosphate galactose phosphotransferase WbaP [Turneriella sp.]|nr:undecaprenyl-phosphate galactose phosphotransferase WbaP [Turneriella sp.]